MAIRTVANQYVGINAHLHSYFQSQGGWDSFHANHLTYLTAALKTKLLPMGYTAEVQQSLQIRRFSEPAGKPESDITIYDTDPARSQRLVKRGGTRELPIPEVMSIDPELSQYGAVAIYEFAPGQSDRGEPVAWIELLSPSNKPGGQDSAYYQDKRLKLLQSGIVFVELDYLHHSPTTFDRLARYVGASKERASQTSAHPYLIAVVDPRPTLAEGTVVPYPFDVDDPIPTVDIPLNAGDVLTFDFDAPYQKTYTEMLYGLEFVDYSQQPLNFDRYSRADQVRIIHRIYTVLKAASEGKDLEASAPLALANMGSDDPVGRIGWKEA